MRSAVVELVLIASESSTRRVLSRSAAARLCISISSDDGLGAADQQLLQMVDAGVERIGDSQRSPRRGPCRRRRPAR